MDSFAKSGSFIIAVSPRTANKHIKPFTKNPYTIDVFAKSGESKGFACCTSKPIAPNWKAAYTIPFIRAGPTGAGLAISAEIFDTISPHCKKIFGI